MNKVIFEIPDGMSMTVVADNMSAYLLGAEALKNADRSMGPFRKHEGDDAHWQLDGTNNYWLHIDEPRKGMLTCRYGSQLEIITAMATLFTLRYVSW